MLSSSSSTINFDCLMIIRFAADEEIREELVVSDISDRAMYSMSSSSREIPPLFACKKGKDIKINQLLFFQEMVFFKQIQRKYLFSLSHIYTYLCALLERGTILVTLSNISQC